MGVCSDLVQTAIPVQTKVVIETVSQFRLASHVLIESCDILFFSGSRGCFSLSDFSAWIRRMSSEADDSSLGRVEEGGTLALEGSGSSGTWRYTDPDRLRLLFWGGS